MEGENEHPSSSLGHSEELSVENPVGPPVPEFAQATEERPKILPSMTGEEARYIFEEDGGRSVALHKVKEGEGEAAALPGEAAPLAGDGEVLARKTAGPEGGVWNTVLVVQCCPCQPCPNPRKVAVISVPSTERHDVSEVRDSRPSLGEDGAGVGVDLGETDGAPSGPLEAKVKSSDA